VRNAAISIGSSSASPRNHSAQGPVSSSDSSFIHSQLLPFHFSFFTFHFSLFTLHFFFPSVRSQPLCFFNICSRTAVSKNTFSYQNITATRLASLQDFHSGLKIHHRRCMQRLYRSLSQLSVLNSSLFTLHFSLFTLFSLPSDPNHSVFSIFVRGRRSLKTRSPTKIFPLRGSHLCRIFIVV